MRSHPILTWLFLAVAVAGLLALAAPARASTDVNMYGYTDSGGGFTPLSNGDSMPLGATLEVHVWTDLFSCDPVRVRWGDGTSSTMNFGGSFSETFTHVYAAEGTYMIYAVDCQGTSGNTATITVGGLGGNLFDPSSAMFVPSVLGPILGLGALGMALGNPRGEDLRDAVGDTDDGTRPKIPTNVWWHPERFKSFVPYGMSTHWVSYRDIPIGAPRRDPGWIPMQQGTPTDIFQTPHCDCGGEMGWVASGWFCLNPACPHRHPDEQPFPRIIHGL